MSARDGLLAKIGTKRYVIDVESVSWATVQPTRQGVDQGAAPGETSLTNEVVWRRVRDNWVGGAGQEYADLADENDESSGIRFDSSEHADPWTRRALTVAREHTISGYLQRLNEGLLTMEGVPTLLQGLGGTDFYVWGIHQSDTWGGTPTAVELVDNTTVTVYTGNATFGSQTWMTIDVVTTGGTKTLNVQLAADSQYDGERIAWGVYVFQNGGNIDCEVYWDVLDATERGQPSTLAGTDSIAGTLDTNGSVISITSHERVEVAVGSSMTAFGDRNNADAYVRVDVDAGAGWLDGESAGDESELIEASSNVTGLSLTIVGTNDNQTTPLLAPNDLGFWVAQNRELQSAFIDTSTGAAAIAGSFNLHDSITALTAGGDFNAYLLLGDATIWKATLDTATPSITCTQLGSETADMIASCGSRLVAALDEELFELSAAGVKTSIWTHFNDRFRWGGAVAAPNAVYAWGNTSQLGAIYQLPISDETGSLDPPILAGTLPTGEYVVTMVPHLGIMVIGTNLGVRLATVSGDGSLTLGPLLEDIGVVQDLATVGTDVYVCTTTAPYVWKLDPTRFTETLVPAFASMSDDVNDDNQPYGESNFSTVPKAIIAQVYAGEAVLVTASTFAYGFYPTSMNYAAQASIDLGWFTYSIGEELSLDSLVVECDPHDGSSTWSVTAYVDTPDSTSVLTGTLDFSSGSNLELFAGSDIRARRFKVRLEIDADQSADTAPIVRAVTLRATPVPFLSDRMILPILLTETVESEYGQQVGLDVWDEWSYLIGLRDSRERVALELGAYTATARVESVQVRAGGLGGGNGLDGWASDGDFMGGVWEVQLVTVGS